MTPLTPAQIATIVKRPAPTSQQQQAITAPLRAGVVVAGAGSGKTETMAARVVWLVANGYVRPDEVLGLTFTRKAATELAQRVRRRLQVLEAAGVVGVAAGEPVVSTYDAFAGRLVTEHGARLGIEPGRRLITPAGAWQRAARLVHGWDGDMDDVISAPDTVVADLLDLHEQAAAHLVDLGDVEAASRRLLDLVEALPPGARQRKPRHHKLEAVHHAQRARLRLLPMVLRYRDEMARDDLADFATVAADAAALAAAFPEVGEQLRGQFRLVLLDEFQDTSFAQLDLLLRLFGTAHAVTAVGDPFQSIYAWRGANADTLTSFAARFGEGAGVVDLSLTTSFRNSRRVLAVANAIAEPLRTGRHQVDTLVPAHGAPPGEVRVALHRTQHDQAQHLADQVVHHWTAARAPSASADGDPSTDAPGDHPRSIGVLVRRRDEMPAIEAALRERGIPVEVVGLDGLLTVPEVADTVALLQVALDPARGDALMRLLTGPLVHLGPRDLAGLARWAACLSPQPEPGQPAVQVPRAGIAECLTDQPPPGWLSSAADARLRRLATRVARVRSRLSQPLPDVVVEAIVALGLDVETLARARRTGGAGNGHLDRLVDEASAFADLAPQAGVREFLDYCAAALTQERGLRRAADVHVGSRVQLLTVHAAKGLEWDVVVVAGLTDGGFPARSRTGRAWLSDAGTLPYPLRGDRERLPRLDTGGVEDQAALAARVGVFATATGELDATEERRLAYVAVTRARSTVLCHGYRWGAGRRPLDPSPFLVEIARAPGVITDVWTDNPGPPPDTAADAPCWPADPLGRHRSALQAGAELVRAAEAERRGAQTRSPATPPLQGAAARWADEVAALLAEQDAMGSPGRQVRLPGHLSATQLVAASRDPAHFLRRLRRPMPLQPRVEARQGTAFHAWVEQRYGSPRLLDLDELPGAADAADPPASAGLAELQEAFLASEWAERIPREIEAPFEMVVDGVVIRGRADAVFDDGDGLIVVDWKTGPPPRTDADVAARSTQLAAYRQAFAALYGLPPDRVRAVFHHVREGVTVEERSDVDRGLSGVLADVAAGAQMSRREDGGASGSTSTR